jgi:hypothetical protein
MTEPKYFVAVQHVERQLDAKAVILDLRGDEIEMNL